MTDFYDSGNKNPGCDDMLRIDTSKRDDAGNLHDRGGSRGTHHRAKIARRLAVRQIAPAIGSVSLDQREFGVQRCFEKELPTVYHFRALALRDWRPYPSRREKSSEARSCTPQAFSQRSLRYQFQLNLLGGIEAVENMGVCGFGERADDLANPPGFEKCSETVLSVTRIVVDDREVASSLIDQRMNQIGRMAGAPETGHKHCASIADIGDCRRDIWAYFVHGHTSLGAER